MKIFFKKIFDLFKMIFEAFVLIILLIIAFFYILFEEIFNCIKRKKRKR